MKTQSGVVVPKQQPPPVAKRAGVVAQQQLPVTQSDVVISKQQQPPVAKQAGVAAQQQQQHQPLPKGAAPQGANAAATAAGAALPNNAAAIPPAARAAPPLAAAAATADDDDDVVELPQFDFVVGGFPKCGTTTLLKAFEAHPETDMAAQEQCAVAAPSQPDASTFVILIVVDVFINLLCGSICFMFSLFPHSMMHWINSCAQETRCNHGGNAQLQGRRRFHETILQVSNCHGMSPAALLLRR